MKSIRALDVRIGKHGFLTVYKILDTRYKILTALPLLVFFTLAFLPLRAEAATLYFTAPPEQVFVGDEFMVEVRLESRGDAINAVRADIGFAPDALSTLSLSRGDSILRLWPEEPSFANVSGNVSFVGGLPHPGFSGARGLIGTMVFSAERAGKIELQFRETSEALRNDGTGSRVPLSLGRFAISVLEPPVGYTPRVISQAPDRSPPDQFEPVIGRSADAFDGNYFVAFSAYDRGSGIDRYEVQEIINGIEYPWRTKTSPAVLEYQSGDLRVRVKAIDRAGNETIGEVRADLPPSTPTPLPIFAILAAAALVILAFLMLRKKRPVDGGRSGGASGARAIILLLFVALAVFAPGGGVIPVAQAAGATFSITPASGTFAPGRAITATVRLHSGGNPVNAAEATINFPPDTLRVTGVSRAGSIFSFWPVEPSFDNQKGVVSFSGGSPAPFSGSSGAVMTITFVVERAGEGAVNFSGGRVLLADGKGTNVFAGAQGAAWTFAVSAPAPVPAPAPSGLSKALLVSSPTHPDQEKWYATSTAVFQWPLPADAREVALLLDQQPISTPTVSYRPPIQEKRVENIPDGVWFFHVRVRSGNGWSESSHFRFQVDITPPEPFTIGFPQGRETQSAQPVVNFAATDRTSGLSYYELRVGDGDFFTVASRVEHNPYTLPVQSPGTRVMIVRAVDAAGNATEAREEFTVRTVSDLRARSSSPWLAVLILLLLVVFAGGLRYVVRLRGRVRHETREADEAIHRAFDLLKEDIQEQIRLVGRAKSGRNLSRGEERVVERLKRDLEDAERFIRKELRDIEEVLNRHRLGR